jgi:hypothetical protein
MPPATKRPRRPAFFRDELLALINIPLTGRDRDGS